MRVNCLSCGHKIELDSAYSDYEGPIRCLVCGARLEIKTEEGGIRSVKEAQSLVAAAHAGNPSGRRPAGRGSPAKSRIAVSTIDREGSRDEHAGTQ